MQNNNKTIILNNFLYYDINYNSSNDLFILGVGHEQCLPDKHEGPKSFLHFSMHIILKGKGHLSIDGKNFNAGENQIVIFPPFSIVEYYPDKNDPWEYIWINFSGVVAQKLCQRCSVTPSDPVFKFVSPEIVSEAERICKLYSNQYSKDIATLGHLYSIFATMIENICQSNLPDISESDTRILHTLEYIQENYTDPTLNLTSISKYAGYHFNYFSQLFAKTMGMHFNTYLNLLRVQRACDLIDKGEKSISEIALKVGFEDPLYFSKVFKKYKLVSPKNYRSQIKSE